MTRRTWTALPIALWIRRADAEIQVDIERFRPELEPLVKLIEDTPRAKCAAMAVDQFRRGVTYRQFLAALFLAGIRNVNPRPPGFALHCVFVIHAAHQLSLEAPPSSRLLPLFYSLDLFKASQERDAGNKAGDWVLTKVRGPLPDAAKARTELDAAMRDWDMERADRAVTAMVRDGAAPAAFDALWEQGARDYRNIGHKAIFPASAHRTLQVIGWSHAEPVLRSVVLGLLDFGKETKVNGYAWTDQCYHGNRARAQKTPARMHGDAVESETRGVLEALRTMTPDAACAEVSARMNAGKWSGGSVWDAVHLASGELARRARSGGVIGGIHSASAVNALHYASLATGDASVRPMMLLQACGWMAQFRTWMESTPVNMAAFDITEANAAPPAPSGERGYWAGAMRMAFTRAGEVHYYKFLAAVMEDCSLVSPRWRTNLMGAVEAYRKHESDAETPAYRAAKEALSGFDA